MKSILRYFNSKAYEHLNVRALWYEKFAKKMFSMFQGSNLNKVIHTLGKIA